MIHLVSLTPVTRADSNAESALPGRELWGLNASAAFRLRSRLSLESWQDQILHREKSPGVQAGQSSVGFGRPRVWWCRRGVCRGVEAEDVLILLQCRALPAWVLHPWGKTSPPA